MAFTIQQHRLTQRVAEMLVGQRRATRIQCQAIKAELDQYAIPQLALDKSQVFAANLLSFLTTLQNNQTEILAAATAVGLSDFASRWSDLNTARDALATATTANIAARLQAVIDGLPEETIL